MSVFWTLLVDVRKDTAGNAAVIMTLLDADRRWHWRVRRDIDRNLLDHQRTRIRQCFSYPRSAGKALSDDMSKLAENLTRDLRLENFLDASRLEGDASLIIDTMVTSIPWDLVFLRGNYLGSELAVSLNIPIANETYFKRGYTGHLLRPRQREDALPVFLHIVADPRGDLRYAESEARDIEAIVGACTDVQYRQLRNPAVLEILDEFERGVRFLHFTGHVMPGRGLAVGSDQILSMAHIESRFPPSDDQVVFLNGCDSQLDQDPEEDQDLFRTASLANVFLFAGAKSVIAPRSRIADGDAREAAVFIWKRLLDDGATLGEAVRDFRRESIRRNPDALAGYSYVLYGVPSVRVAGRRPAVASGPAQAGVAKAAAAVRQHEILREAALDADGEIAPRHLFGALTRRWRLGRVFFSVFGQEYIETLVELRRLLGCRQVAGQPPAQPQIVLSSGSTLLLERMAKAAAAAVGEAEFLTAIGTMGDPEISGAIRQLRISSWELKDLCEAAVLSDQESLPLTAIFDPGGWVVRDRLLRNFPRPASDIPREPAPPERTVGVWDLFLAVAGVAESHLRRFLQDKGLGAPPPGTWRMDEALHWCHLTPAARAAMFVAGIEMNDEEFECISESHLVYALSRDGSFDFEELSTEALKWLENGGIGPRQWAALAHEISLERLRWPNA